MPYQNTALRIPNILIIDDDATIRLLMHDALTDEEYNITEASNGIDALKQITKQRPSLVLLDVKMPGIDGFDVCDKIRHLYGDTDVSIVMVTGMGDSASIERAYSLGATDFIVKPINWDTFPYRIQYLIKARNAIIETKYRELHLQHIENISRILTQNKTQNDIVQEVLSALLGIFSADRAFIIKPVLPANNTLYIDCEKTSENTKSIIDMQDSLFDALGSYTFHRANHSEYPVVILFNESNPAPSYDTTIKRQMIKALHLQKNQTCYLVLQQNSTQMNWSTHDEETFYKISLRLTGILSRYLLTEQLHISERLLKQAQKIGHLGNWNWNAKTNQLTWSEEIFHIYGHPPDRWHPECEDFFEIDFEEDIQRLNLFKNILNNTNKSYQLEHRITNTSKNIRWIREQALGTYDENGALLEVNGVVQDITETYFKKEQEVHNNKMDAIGQLTSGVAHDFGNLMTVAKGNLDLLNESMSKTANGSSEDLELIADAYSAVEDSVELTKQLLAFSRKKSIAPIAVNVKDTVNKFHKLFENTVGNNIKLTIHIQKNLPNILVDPAQFESALLNIIINARNAMPNGGTLSVCAEQMATQRTQEIIRNADNNLGEQCICIYIKDDGVGMSKEILDRVIEPFYTTSKTSGTGLGMSMVYGFIKQSSGELVIHSKPAKGTTIYLQFPLYENLIIEKSPPEKIIELLETEATILIVEDQPAVRQFAARCLKKPGINILQAQDAIEARELLSNHDDIDLLFTDVLMPGDMNGHELAGWANKKYPNLKILLTTAMENRPSSEQPERNHDFQMLAKPYNKNELTESISRSLE
ncbi:Sensory box histidine kinase/response regulator [hydrothermal vent metagenome]|uniref:Sensory box histidine kinase/response regulator n=1 Tax=hydrothermal vent metagenome TaxID=652676 RepID=A0A3B0X859_9ZZZZ